jgi:signal transduction histidine kinase
MSQNSPYPQSPRPEPRSVMGTALQNQDFQILDLAFLGSLVPGIIHNLATPLSGVIGATQLLEKRASGIEEMLRDLEALGQAEREELAKQWDRNRANVDILSRNAQHLAEVLQQLVQRINRGHAAAKEDCSLNELLETEMRFLEANLSFKHKVKRQVRLGPEDACADFAYGHAASAIDEFVIGAVSMHDFNQGNMEMDFATGTEEGRVWLSIAARFQPLTPDSETPDPVEFYLDRLRTEGWTVEHERRPGMRRLNLSHPARGAPS